MRENSHKETVTHPNGFKTFKDLHVGERLILPEKWFSKEFDELPPSYFAALPHPDGVTPGKTTGVLGDEPVATSAARAAAAVIAADPSYCVSVAQPGSAVNSTVHAFKTAWNTENPTNPVPINTGTYEQATADAIKSVLGTAPAACAPRALVPPQRRRAAEGPGTGVIVGLALLGAGAVGAAIYFATKPEPAPRVRRIRPSRPRPITRPDFPETEYWDGIAWRKPYAP